MKESFEREIQVAEWDPEIFTAIIRFIYSDQVLFSQDTQTDRVWSLFMAAKYYGLDRLLRLCEQFLISEKLSLETVCLLWNVSAEVDAKQVEAACRKYFEQQFENIIVHPCDNFNYLHKDLFLNALKSEDLMVSDQDKVAKAVLKWGQAQMSNPNTNITKQELFCTFFPLLRLRRKNPSGSLPSVEDLKKAVGISCAGFDSELRDQRSYVW